MILKTRPFKVAVGADKYNVLKQVSEKFVLYACAIICVCVCVCVRACTE